MHMRVHKARDNDLAADVDFFYAVIKTQTRDDPVTDRDVLVLELFGKDIQYARAFEDEVGFLATHRHVDDSLEVHMMPPLPVFYTSYYLSINEKIYQYFLVNMSNRLKQQNEN